MGTRHCCPLLTARLELSHMLPAAAGVERELLLQVGRAITALPENFTFHRQVKKVYDLRAKMIAEQEDLDWAMSEALAFGTLLAEGNHVRLSGQDVERGATPCARLVGWRPRCCCGNIVKLDIHLCLHLSTVMTLHIKT